MNVSTRRIRAASSLRIAADGCDDSHPKEAVSHAYGVYHEHKGLSSRALSVLVTSVRSVHLAAVIAAFVFMFLPATNDYFRHASSATGAPGSSIWAATRMQW